MAQGGAQYALVVRKWRAKASELFRQWRVARYQRGQARSAQRDKRAAEDLDRARSGADRFPPMGV